VLFSCFALPDMFSAVSSASGPVLIFCAPEIIFSGPEGDKSRNHVLHVGTIFWRYRVCRVPFSSFALPDTFSVVRRALGPVFMFCAPGLIFSGNEGVGSRFHLLRSQSHFPRYQGLRFPFSYFALPDSFSAVPWASDPVFMFCAP
jgi:hypothetical protein